jgi:hypothetical protein
MYVVFSSVFFVYDFKFDGVRHQAAAFAKRIASRALTLEFAAERQQLEGRIERLQAQHTEVVRDKLAAT